MTGTLSGNSRNSSVRTTATAVVSVIKSRVMAVTTRVARTPVVGVSVHVVVVVRRGVRVTVYTV